MTSGSPRTRGGATPFSQRLTGAKLSWEFKPEQARGKTEICRLDPRSGAVTRLTQNQSPDTRSGRWDFRASESPEGRQIVFCRAETGGPPAIWVMDTQGRHPRLLTRGLDDQGAEQPRWLP